ncbi:UDP-N-acetylmuramate--L-alanine ligase [Helicobacter didelphidarum]|uniref:UDP-N-acetylmuramate--L-alanine ligase n=1 Tax=Helicobacter didelphidarum TaxID=2040648 RepID=A0A3D8IR75_9HELI|nr:UDP-N-acetylmuramate--L-alanine ligase [Helicobacter didelphidarum]RDU67104.1 UDP-N-acetylmuramate--L-alanine ligase [Helicobacter didelphidarum]
MNFHKLKVHFIGIGGIGVSGLARFLKVQGAIVSGSDIMATSITKGLQENGISITIPHNRDIIADKDLIIHSAIIKDSNIEIQEARKLKKQILSRKEALKILLSEKKVLSICAAHGKSSTSAILAAILSDSGAIIGAISKEFDSNVRVSNDKWLVFEADESDKSFLNSNPYKSIVVNIEAEHLESYNHDFLELKNAYLEFLKLSKDAVINVGCPVAKEIYNRLVHEYGFLPHKTTNQSLNNKTHKRHEKNIECFDIKEDVRNICFTLRDLKPYTNFELRDFGEFSIYGIGEHHIVNASIAILSAIDIIDIESIRTHILHFQGIKKRFDILQHLSSHTPCIIDDYAHHPTEITATLNAVKIYAKLLQENIELQNNISQHHYNKDNKSLKITAIFQPHKYSRFRDNLEAFCKCFKDCDEFIILPVWAAGEEEMYFDFKQLFSANNPILANKVQRHDKYLTLFDEHNNIIKKLDSGIIVGLGAGDITYQLRGEK